jgi:hypothetical protein
MYRGPRGCLQWTVEQMPGRKRSEFMVADARLLITAKRPSDVGLY